MLVDASNFFKIYFAIVVSFAVAFTAIFNGYAEARS